MQEIRFASVNKQKIPVLISDEKEALLAAKAAGRAVIGLWRQGQEAGELSAAGYVAEDLSDVTEEFVERVARRQLGLPWKICQTRRLVVREIFAEDFDEIWTRRIGRGFGTVEELIAYTKHQYMFYEFGFWAVIERESGRLIGVAGLTIPQEEEGLDGARELLELVACREQTEVTLELGYHIFRKYRRQGYARESCLAILQYGTEVLGAGRFVVRVARDNEPSKQLALGLGFRPATHKETE